MLTLLTLAAVAALAYQFAATAACVSQSSRRIQPPRYTPPVSILKPVRGLDVDFEAAIESHAAQDYPEFEILFGVHDPADPAVPSIEALIAAHPDRPIRLIHCATMCPNAKVGILTDLVRHARYDVLLVNDSDISVPEDYLRSVVAPLANPRIGLVTCIYRAVASSIAGRWEAFGIGADFIPSTLVAPMVGFREFGLGSTLVFRCADLERAGGFEPIGEYIADDYQLAKRINALGLPAHLSRTVVETHLGAPGFGEVWRHQIRWARTIRVSRGDGYIGLPVTHAGVWALLCLAAGLTPWAIALLLARAGMAFAAGTVLRDQRVRLLCWLAPVWDLFAFVVWIAGWSGAGIDWRGTRMTLTRDGRLLPAPRT